MGLAVGTIFVIIARVGNSMEAEHMRQHYVAKVMVCGLLGTLLQTLMVYGVAPVMAGHALNMAVLLERSCAPGLLAHLLSGGVIFPLGYIVLSSQSFSGS